MTKLVFTLLLAVLAGPLTNRAAEDRAPTVRAILIVASKERGPSDPKLAPYEGILRDNLRFESYRYVGEGSAPVPGAGKVTINLPQGNSVDVSTAGGSITVSRDGRSAPLSPGGPGVVLLGGSAGKGEVFGIIAVAR